MAEEKLFSKAAVITAISLTARSMAGLVTREEALKTLENLPETLAECVMEEVVKAHKAQAAQKAKVMSKVLGMLAQGLTDGEKED